MSGFFRMRNLRTGIFEKYQWIRALLSLFTIFIYGPLMTYHDSGFAQA